MKAVMLSIKPKWCKLIASGKKTVEVRKTRPKLDTPFKCYIYCTKKGDYVYRTRLDENRVEHAEVWNGKVIGEFLCDEIIKLEELKQGGYYIPQEKFGYACLTVEETRLYGKGKNLYAWHISDIVIYDKPKELSEFRTVCHYRNDDGSCQYDKIDCDCSKFDFNPDYSVAFAKCCDYMDRPPQSRCYVEELNI